LVLAVGTSGLAQRGASPPIIPDPKLTPGDVLDVTKADICVSGYSKKVRNVPQAVKEQAYKEYGITHRAKDEYEVDHLISLELGGSNSQEPLAGEFPHAAVERSCQGRAGKRTPCRGVFRQN
jgi:hypothetical protein